MSEDRYSAGAVEDFQIPDSHAFYFFAFELGVQRKYYPFQGMSYNPQKYKNLSRGYKKNENQEK